MKKKLALQCVDLHGRKWTYEYVNMFNFWHILVWNLFPKFMSHQTDGIHCDFKPRTFKWRII